MIESGNYPCIRNQDLNKLDISFKECISKVNPRVLKKTLKIITKGVVIMSDMGTDKGVGKACAFMGSGNPIIGNSVVAIEHNENPVFLAYMINSLFVRKQILMKMKGTLVQHLRSKDLKNLDIPLPDRDTQDRMADIITKIGRHMGFVNELSESYRELVANVTRKALNQ